MADITVAICTYNRCELLKQVVLKLSEQTLDESKYKILIVDNSDSEVAKNDILKYFSNREDIEIIHSSPPGLSRARNKAIEACKTKYIAFIDDDALPDPRWLEELVRVFQKTKASVIAGPIEPVWPRERPAWLPIKYQGCLTIIDYGSKDRKLTDFEFAYGANMAFVTNALKEVGGFNISLGRTGNKTLISDEEIETQLALRARNHKSYYAAGARVFHAVHDNRISRNYFRSRMAWQAVSTLMHDSPLWWIDQSKQEIQHAGEKLGISDLLHRLFAVTDADTFTAQIDFLYHFLLVLLNSNNETDSKFEEVFSKVSGLSERKGGEFQHGYNSRFTEKLEPISLETLHLFIDSPSSHAFLFDVYARIPRAQMITFHNNLWENSSSQLKSLQSSLAPHIKTITFTTIEPFIYGPTWHDFLCFIDAVDIPVFGILHRLPWTEDNAESLRKISKKVNLIVLAESMQNKLHNVYNVSDVIYMPLHATHSPYIGVQETDLRKRVGATSSQIIFSILGEARKGKGIDLLLESLNYLNQKDRENMFFIFAGRSKDFSKKDVQNSLSEKQCNGYVDLRESVDPLNYAVLTEQELGRYINITDVGILLYQEDQRNCMSGVLPNYALGGKPVLATSDSIVGQLIRKENIGIALDDESPKSVANALSALLHQYKAHDISKYRNEKYQVSISQNSVLQNFESILESSYKPNTMRTVN